MAADFADIFQGMAIDELRKRATHLSELAMRQSRVSGNQLRRIDVLEHNFGRLLLVVHSLYETAVRNGSVTAAQFAAIYHELDLRDGSPDHRLDPSAVPGMQVDDTPRGVHEFFASLRSNTDVEEQQSAVEFLKGLEESDGAPPSSP